jgi:uncharacterized ferredoxin-like protein
MKNSEEACELISKGVCPVCKGRLSHREGCLECGACGWSECEEA